MAFDVENYVQNKIRHEKYLRFKTFYSSICCLFFPTLGSTIILLFWCTTLHLYRNITYNPSDISTCTTFCLYLSIELSAERNKEKKRREMSVSHRYVVNYTDKGRWGESKDIFRSVKLVSLVHYFGHSFGQNSPVDQMTARCIWIVNILIVYQSLNYRSASQ